MERTVVILQSETGLHARPAAQIMRLAEKFDAKVQLEKNGQSYNAKSIMGLLSMGAKKGDELSITAEGNDAAGAVQAIKELIDRDFAE